MERSRQQLSENVSFSLYGGISWCGSITEFLEIDYPAGVLSCVSQPRYLPCATRNPAGCFCRRAYPTLPRPCFLWPGSCGRSSPANAFIAPSPLSRTASPAVAGATTTGLSMVAAGSDTKVLEQPLIADDITQLIGKVPTLFLDDNFKMFPARPSLSPQEMGLGDYRERREKAHLCEKNGSLNKITSAQYVAVVHALVQFVSCFHSPLLCVPRVRVHVEVSFWVTWFWPPRKKDDPVGVLSCDVYDIRARVSLFITAAATAQTVGPAKPHALLYAIVRRSHRRTRSNTCRQTPPFRLRPRHPDHVPNPPSLPPSP